MIKSNWLRVAEVLRLADENGNLSLSNLVVLVAVGKVLAAPTLAVPDILALLGALGSYQFKRWMQPDVTAPAENAAATQAAIESLQTKVSALQMAGQIKR